MVNLAQQLPGFLIATDEDVAIAVGHRVGVRVRVPLVWIVAVSRASRVGIAERGSGLNSRGRRTPTTTGGQQQQSRRKRRNRKHSDCHERPPIASARPGCRASRQTTMGFRVPACFRASAVLYSAGSPTQGPPMVGLAMEGACASGQALSNQPSGHQLAVRHRLRAHDPDERIAEICGFSRLLNRHSSSSR